MKDFDHTRFKKLLDASHVWPCDYMFKFIVKTEQVNFVRAAFNENEVNLKPSSNGNYVSLTVTTRMASSDEILAVYERMSRISGVIAL